MRIRLLVGYATVLAILPYLGLKLAWVAGSTIGIDRPEVAEDPTLYGLNLLTLLMDSVAIGVVLAFTHRWGQRLPAWLILPPIWVGTGFLVPILLIAPVAAAAGAWSGQVASSDFLESWVTPVVYTSFGAQGLGLTFAFILYARARWPRVFTMPVGARPTTVTQSVYILAAWLATALVGLAAGLRLSWTFGSTAGRPDVISDGGLSQLTVNTGHALLALAGALGLLGLVHRWGRARRTWPAVTLAWIGSAAMWSWGMWGVLIRLVAWPGDDAGGDLLPAVDIAQVLAGTVIALVGALILVEMQSAVSREASSDVRMTHGSEKRVGTGRTV